eukprot:jgi/Picsp_1/4766/NSC_02134-R1_transcription factor jumonji domain-containing protein
MPFNTEQEAYSVLQQQQQPIVLRGLVSSWPACSSDPETSWEKSTRLLSLVGDSLVDVLVSESDQPGYFVGDMSNLTMIEMSMRDFICRQSDTDTSKTCSCLYVAQAPVAVADLSNMIPGPLYALMEDMSIPGILSDVKLSSINAWCSKGKRTTSSLHYDPHDGLLCAVSGEKNVRLLPPTATPHVRARPLYHESSNHALVNIWSNQADMQHLLTLGLKEHTVYPGDAIFIPQGWWHQVQSDNGTLAINFWWDRDLPFPGFQNNDIKTTTLGDVPCVDKSPSMHGYVFRRACESLLYDAKLALLQEATQTEHVKYLSHRLQCMTRTSMKHDYLLDQMAKQHMVDGPKASYDTIMACLYSQGLTATTEFLRHVAEARPEIMSRFLEHASPLCWEILTLGLETFTSSKENPTFHSMSSNDSPTSTVTSETHLSEFYRCIYSCYSQDPSKASLTAIMLQQKEHFSRHALISRVLSPWLGIASTK